MKIIKNIVNLFKKQDTKIVCYEYVTLCINFKAKISGITVNYPYMIDIILN